MPLTMNGRTLTYEMPRQHISAHDGPELGPDIRKRLEEAKEKVRALKPAVACPAGCLIGQNAANGLTVRCGVERSLIAERTDPSSLASFCLTDGGSNPNEGYQRCPSWRAEKEREWAGRSKPLVSSREGV